MTTITIDRAVVQQALEALETLVPTKGPSIYNSARDALRAALAQQDEPVLVQGELPPRYVARSPIQAEPVEPVATLTAQRDDILRMAREAGLLPNPEVYVEDLDRFAALVAAAERDACAALLEANGMRCGEESLSRLILETNAAAIRARTP